MIIKACIFDLDGVIVDTAVYHYQAWKRLALELGFDFTKEDNERLKGISRLRSLEILLETGGLSFSAEKMRELAAKKNQWYVEDIMKMTRDEILPGVLPFLQSLKDNGVKIALGSASKNAPTILQRIEMESYFDVVIDGNRVAKAKPDPEVFLKAARELKVKPRECVVFEDAEAGITAARNGHMHCVGVGSPDNLRNADFVISSFEEMSLARLNFFTN